MNKSRSVYIDILKAIGIFLIVLSHLSLYVHPIYSKPLEYISIHLGIGFFTFGSGYGLAYHYNSLNRESIIPFIRRRLQKIYPSYIFIFIVFLILTRGQYFGHIDLLIYALCMQGIAGSGLFANTYLWFIGFIFFCYLYFAIIAYYNFCKKYIFIASIFVYVMMLIANIYFNLIDIRMIYYFPIFILGVITSRNINRLNSRADVISISAFIIASILLLLNNFNDYYTGGFHNKVSYADSIYILSICLYTYSATLILYRLSQSTMIGTRYNRIIVAISNNSYYVYLTNLPVIFIASILLSSIFKDISLYIMLFTVSIISITLATIILKRIDGIMKTIFSSHIDYQMFVWRTNK